MFRMEMIDGIGVRILGQFHRLQRTSKKSDYATPASCACLSA